MVYSSGKPLCTSIKITLLDSSLLFLLWERATSTKIPPGMKLMWVSEPAQLTQFISPQPISTQTSKWRDSQTLPPWSLIKLSLKAGTITPWCGPLPLSLIWLMKKSIGLKLTQPRPRSPGDAPAIDSFSELMEVSLPLPLTTLCIFVASSTQPCKHIKITHFLDSQLYKIQLFSSFQI